jgi:hypothetical protein
MFDFIWKPITPEMTGEYIREEYRKEILETGKTLDTREEVIAHLMKDSRHNFSNEEANKFYDDALAERKIFVEEKNKKILKELGEI